MLDSGVNCQPHLNHALSFLSLAALTDQL